ncbi:MAG TPA: TolC family protein [Bryobacteraceae bacterium]|nr:TolC family protein [Bryobacteraceae bacterium]
MFKAGFLSLALLSGLHAEVFSLTLRQAVGTALKQNPDITLSRMDEDKARQAVRVARDPFSPRFVVGSGLAYTNGFPMSLEGSAPSIFQANVTQFLFNRQQSYMVAQTRENARAAQIGTASKQEEVVYRTTTLYLDAERAARVGDLARKDAASLQTVLEAVQAQVREGRALPLAEKQANLNLARAREVAGDLAADQETAETALAMALGYTAQDRVRATADDHAPPAVPDSVEDVIRRALASSSELRRLESQIAAKTLEIRGAQAARLPRVDLVAQYSMLSKINNYEQFFQRFQRNNVEIGASFQLPLLTGPGLSAQMAQAQIDINRLRAELASTRNRIASDIQQSFRDLNKTDSAAEVARLDLDVARDQTSVLLSQMQEGRATLRQVEEARVAENGKWMAFYDAQSNAERARWNLLRLSGNLLAALTPKP